MAKSQKVLITIGYQQFMLPDDTGAATVIKTLSRALPVRNYHSHIKLEREDRTEISMTYLPANIKLVDENDVPISTPKTPAKGLKRLPPPQQFQLGWGDHQ